ncbi:DUF2637 domain-containing protein [Streptomyces sp. ASQP_92]|uniref:DUF2637 domain-containing protein n=1 Tax=Streptomyces sp. ASQP_92 TaxID=2979116 RepID=UPI0021BE9859|nr:DUF2637 domain-containing protein [Streptomyces sp. ASQP_92]MCT9091626.1 DUF2637 domain-containing protein [Streptomyces sp. ASQP_92]
MTTKPAAERTVLIVAGAVIAVLTAGAFALSYAHLADVAGQHGLGSSPVRRWAWPATLDAFIVAGELLMLRAGLRHVTDRWAIAATVIGSVGSISLNVAGVSGANNTDTVPFLDYVVAAVPPLAAMLAFAVLMQQIHQLVEHPAEHPDPVSGQEQEAPVIPSSSPVGVPAAVCGTPRASASDTGPRSHDQTHPAREHEPEEARSLAAYRNADPVSTVPERNAPVKPERKRTGKGKGGPPGREPDLTDAELQAIAHDLTNATGVPSVTDMRAELKRRNHKAATERITKALKALKAGSGAGQPLQNTP